VAPTVQPAIGQVQASASGVADGAGAPVSGSRENSGWLQAARKPAGDLIPWLATIFSFWNVVPIIGVVGLVYLYGFADSFYQSQAIINLQSASSSSSLGSLAGGLLGGSTSSPVNGELTAYISSPDMLKVLDKQFHLRALYSSTSHSPFWRLAPGASDEDFLTFYQQMVNVSQDSTTNLMTISVLDYDANRAQQINKAVTVESERFVNALTKMMQDATVKFAKQQLNDAMNAVETAQPDERPVAEDELSSAQTAMATAEGMASQQAVFLIPIASPNLPTDTAVPDALVDEAGLILAASIAYMILYLLASNVTDHRKI
jgi:capsule polysaccharide export protein KpsE/RkpR